MKYNIRRYLYNLLALLSVAGVYVACSSSDDTVSDDCAVVRLAFYADEHPAQTRTLDAVTWSQVKCLAVAIFDNAGTQIGNTRAASPTEISGMYTLDVQTHKATGCTIYAAANLPDEFYGDGSSKSGVEAKKVVRTSLADLGNDDDIPMFGAYPNTVDIISGTQTFGQIQLKRICSKIDIRITPATGITINGYQLCHLPLGSYYVERGVSTWTAPTTYADFDEVNGLESTEAVTANYFTYENLSGSNTAVTTEKERYQANAPAEATYLLVKATGPGWRTLFRIYLGGVNPATNSADHADFNIYRNCRYTLDIAINGASSDDLRIDKGIEPLSLTTDINPWDDTNPAGTGEAE